MAKSKFFVDQAGFRRDLNALGLDGRKGHALFTRGITRGLKRAQRGVARRMAARLGIGQKHILARGRAWIKTKGPRIGFGWGNSRSARIPLRLLRPRRTASGMSHLSWRGRLERKAGFRIKGKEGKGWFRRKLIGGERVGRSPIERVPGLLPFFENKDLPIINAKIQEGIDAQLKIAEQKSWR